MPRRPTAAELDAADPLAEFRERFVIRDHDLVYLDGNSLGRLPKASLERSRHLVEVEWGDRLIRAWNEGWWDAPIRIGSVIADVVGAGPGEVIVADSTSVNLFKLAVAALQLRPGRRRILTDDLNFPSDRYILEAAAGLTGSGHAVETVRSADGVHGPVAGLVDRLDDDVALLSLSHVVFASGYRYDLDSITAAAHDAGALVMWDLSHSAGAVPIDLSGSGVDLAVGCTYKYLNGGPGAPAFLYVRRELQPEMANPIAGWWGHAAPFDFAPDFAAAGDVRRLLTGTAPMLSLALIEPGVELVREAGLDRLGAKSRLLSEYFIDRWSEELQHLGFSLNSPLDPDERGSHVSLGHAEALGIDLALINDFGVLPDFRPPDNLRFGLAPLYTSFADVDATVEALATIVAHDLHVPYAHARPPVT